jgi:fucose permease
MQLLHFAFGLGAFLSPLIITLVDTIVTSIYGPGELVSINPNTGFETYNKQLHVRVSYVTLGIINFSAAVLIIALLRGSTPAKKEEPNVELEDVETLETQDNKLLGEDHMRNEAELHDEPAVEPVVTEPNEEAELEALEQKRIQKKGIVISVLTGIALLFYVGAEIGFGGLIYSYVVEMRKIAGEVEGNLLNSAFWLS